MYNIAGGTDQTNKELTSLILQAFDFGEEMVQPVADRLGHDRRYSVNWNKINRELGYRPTKSLENSLDDVITWYRNNETWWRPLKDKR
jgi:dTDP-glucose 4,6-dehydratase